MADEGRTEEQVRAAMDANENVLFEEVLAIEWAKVHAADRDGADDIIDAVRRIIP